MEEERLGNIYGFDSGNYAGNVYDKDNLAPTIRTFQGGNQQPMIVAMRGRNPDNPSDRTAGIPTEQRLELNSQGICNCLTSVQKDNMVLIKQAANSKGNEKFFAQAMKTLRENNCQIGDTINAYNESVNKSGISPTITTRPEGFKTAILPVIEQYRIRKLTPLECWRLMGFSDGDFCKAAAVNSNTQLYKQAGNSIVLDVLIAIFGQMIPESEVKMTENEIKALNWMRSIKDDTLLISEPSIETFEKQFGDIKTFLHNEINVNAKIIEQSLKELDEYRSIGTVGECQEAVEKQRKKKLIARNNDRKIYMCQCGNTQINTMDNYCGICGQAILWECDNEEIKKNEEVEEKK